MARLCFVRNDQELEEGMWELVGYDLIDTFESQQPMIQCWLASMLATPSQRMVFIRGDNEPYFNHPTAATAVVGTQRSPRAHTIAALLTLSMTAIASLAGVPFRG